MWDQETGAWLETRTEESEKPRYEKTLREILEWSMGDLDRKITDSDSFQFTWDQGYVIFHHEGPEIGNGEFRGVFHPNVVCEGGGVCIYCGCTLQFD